MLRWKKTESCDLTSEEWKNKLVFTNDYPSPKFNFKLNENNSIYYLEIGCQEGRGPINFMKKYFKNKESKCYCLDIFEIPIMERNFDHNIKVSNFQDNVVKIKGPSWKTLITIDLFEKFDVIYIDGWHGANGVIEDAILSWRLLKVGGFLCFDDYNWGKQFKIQRTPKLAIDSFYNIFYPFLEVVNKDTNIDKVIFKKTISNDNEIPHLIENYENK